MRAWNDLADQYGTDKTLADLDAEQIKAVVDLLLLVMYADDKASIMEQMEFEDQLCKLPAMADKREMLDAYVPGAIARVRAAKGEVLDNLVAQIADTLDGESARRTAFEMAASLAYADIQLALTESATLSAVARGFGLEPDEAQKILDQNA